MIPDETYLGQLGLSVRLMNTLRSFIESPMFEGRHQMTFGNAKQIRLIEIASQPNVGKVTLAEWKVFLEASSAEEAVRSWRNKLLHVEIAKYEKALVNYKRGIETQERRLAELRAQLEKNNDNERDRRADSPQCSA
jgi:hypothetical protein